MVWKVFTRNDAGGRGEGGEAAGVRHKENSEEVSGVTDTEVLSKTCSHDRLAGRPL